MKELEASCKTCIHKRVCACLDDMTNIINNVNTDINSGNYPSNIVPHISCTDYIRESAIPRNDPDTYF